MGKETKAIAKSEEPVRQIGKVSDWISIFDQDLPLPTSEEIRSFICPEATNADIFNFLASCKAMKLNPFKKEVYLVKMQANKPAAIIVDYKVYLARACGNPNYRGFKCVENYQGQKCTGATCWIYFKDGREPFEWTVLMDEFNKKQALWLIQPVFQIKKTAIKQAHYLAMPKEYEPLAEAEVLEPSEIKALEIQGKTEVKVDETFFGDKEPSLTPPQAEPKDEELENQPAEFSKETGELFEKEKK